MKYLFLFTFISISLFCQGQRPVYWKQDFSHKTVIPYTPPKKEFDLPPIDWSAPRKEYTPRELTEEEKSRRKGSGRFTVKGVIVLNDANHPPLPNANIQPIGKFRHKGIEMDSIHLLQVTTTSNKKGKFAFQPFVDFLMSDSIYYYWITHPEAEPYPLAIHFGLTGKSVDVDTVFMTPIHSNSIPR